MRDVIIFLCKVRFLLTGTLIFSLAAVPVLADQKIKIVPTRMGVTVPVLLNIPFTPPKAVLVMFPGSGGAETFKEKDGQIRLGRNFLVRTSPKFVELGLAVAIVDVPSDQAGGMSDGFRNSPEHTRDIQKVIDFLDTQGLQPIYLVGTSRGTLSVAYLGMELQDNRVKGLVLSSSLGGALGGFPLSRIILPVLLVHHRDDACKAMSYHGFLGREDLVVRVIADWITGKQVAVRIGN